MPIRFRKSIGGKGLKINLSKSGIGISASTKGFRIGTGPRGTRVTASLPGTGISLQKTIGNKMDKVNQRTVFDGAKTEQVRETQNIENTDQLVNPKKISFKWLGLLVIIALAGFSCLISFGSFLLVFSPTEKTTPVSSGITGIMFLTITGLLFFWAYRVWKKKSE